MRSQKLRRNAAPRVLGHGRLEKKRTRSVASDSGSSRKRYVIVRFTCPSISEIVVEKISPDCIQVKGKRKHTSLPTMPQIQVFLQFVD